MRKCVLLDLLEGVKKNAELREIEQGTMTQVLILLLDYINDSDVQQAVDDIPM